jgi:cytochrome c oxidase subunit II
MGACTGNEPRTPQARGRVLSRQLECVSCHTPDGRPSVGPTWKGLYGSEVILEDGTTVRADEGYLRESILKPDAETVKGFNAGVMERAVKKGSLSDDQVDDLIAYIKTLK